MNAPFKPPLIEEVLADACVSVTTLKKNPAAVIAEAQHRQVAVLSRNRPVAYVISPQVWEFLNDMLVDHRVEAEALEALESNETGVEIDLDAYL